ncbi:hypothetical protein [Streptomyces sp. NBC_00588]|uniref:hypothetical protein n=1 Tax=Streptomyces sp. NBC_00588 TaxID=2975784 RepID=UPI002E7FB55A|nr:hypothetical protein [Streptomyces sp. NBC_00588]WUB33852.1 hypothetical protein OHN38_02600 [Streptomyces sp. NBC_00588]
MAASGHAPIVVGVDPGPAHHLVLAWGADEADRREAPLHLILGQGRPADGKPARQLRDGAVRERRRLAEHVLRDAVAFVTDRHPRLEVRAQLARTIPCRSCGGRRVRLPPWCWAQADRAGERGASLRRRSHRRSSRAPPARW